MARWIALALTVAACSGAPATASPAGRPAPPPVAVGTGGLSVTVPVALSFDDPGFHYVVEGSGVLDTAIAAGSTMVLSLRDAGRPSATCDRDHPLSGCVTVDWSDDPGRPQVPESGVFDNHLTVGSTTWFLSESGQLAPVSDIFRPG